MNCHHGCSLTLLDERDTQILHMNSQTWITMHARFGDYLPKSFCIPDPSGI
jgi:hypothetical protein